MLYGRMSLLADERRDDRTLNPGRVSRHSGNEYDFIQRHQDEAALVRAMGRQAMAEVAPCLLKRVADSRTLRVAWDHMSKHGGQSPGLDGMRYTDLDDRLIWDLCRSLGEEILSGNYAVGPERVVSIPKGAGRGRRPLVIQSIIDRVAQRAVVEIIQPYLDPLFDHHSFGFRPRRGCLNALALAERFFAAGRRIWVTDDIRDAFLHVSIPRLLQLVRKYLRSDSLADLIERLTSSAATPGLRQGGPLSPILLNLYLHHFLDRPWRKLCPEVPMLRYADDVLVACRSIQQARLVCHRLAALLFPCGMELKGLLDDAIRDLSPAKPADWLGYLLIQHRGALEIRIADRAVDVLAEHLALIPDDDSWKERAFAVVCGWLSHLGPCYPFEDVEKVHQRVSTLVGDMGRIQVVGPNKFTAIWQRAYARWCRLRQT